MAFRKNKTFLKRDRLFRIGWAICLFYAYLHWVCPEWQASLAQARSLTEDVEETIVVGGRVWLDSDGDGIQGAGEPGISSTTVVLFDAAGTLIAATDTDSTGIYRFNELQPGSYYAILDWDTLPPNFVPTLSDIDDDVNDSDLLPELGRTAPTPPIPMGRHYLTLDMGVYALATINSRAWDDQDADGIQDAGEPGLSEVRVHLLDSIGEALMTTATNKNGYYHFEALSPGRYQLQFVPPEHYRLSSPYQGSDYQLDSDAVPLPDDPSKAQTVFFNLLPGQNAVNFDLGLYGIASVEGLAWMDFDGDGVRSQGETALSDVTVELYSEDETLLAQSVTDDTGVYSFDSLLLRECYLRFVPPEGLLWTHNPSSAESADEVMIISHADSESGRIILTELSTGVTVDGQNVGFTEPTTIEDQIWLDENLNGLLDPDESGVADITVILYNNISEQLATTQSDSQGVFQFKGLLTGEYIVQIQRPDEYKFTQVATNDSGENSDVLDADVLDDDVLEDRVRSVIHPVTSSTGVVRFLPGLQKGFASAGLRALQPTDFTPTASEIINIDAWRTITSNKTQIVIRWESQDNSRSIDDVELSGYYIYRSVDGERTTAARITPDLLGPHFTDGALHQWVDDSILPNLNYQYWIVSVIGGEEETEFGPIEIAAAEGIQAQQEDTEQPSSPAVITVLDKDGYIYLPLIYRD